MSADFSGCLHEANPAGGFARQHGGLCWYSRDCFSDAIVHVRVLDTRWCGNVCGRCRDKLAKTHRIKTSELRGLEDNYGKTENAAVR